MQKKYTYIYVLTIFMLAFVFCAKDSLSEVPGWRYVEGAGQSIKGYPSWLFQKPKHYEFSSNKSNFEIQSEFPQNWQDENWDSKKWPKGWDADNTILKLFKGDIFKRHYLKEGQSPVLVLGPQFYRLSAMDRERVVKLFAEQSDILNKGFDILQLVDWGDHRIVGSYTKYGMFLY